MRTLFTIILFIWSFTSSGQSSFGAWTGIGLSLEQTKDLSYSLDAELRIDQNLNRLERCYFSPGVKYDLSKLIRLGTSYRLSLFPNENERSNRLTVDLELRKLASLFLNSERFDMSIRLRATRSDFRNAMTEQVIRGKALFTYDLPGTKLKPEISAELFYTFNDQLVYTNERVYGIHRFTKYRLRVGLDHTFDSHGLNLFYQLQSSLLKKGFDHAIGVRYQFKIK